MAADPIRELLASLEQADDARRPPDTVAVGRSGVQAAAEEAGLEPAAVEAWIVEHGGRLLRPPPVRAQGVRAGRRVAAPPLVPEPYYVIPRVALKA